MQVGGLWTGGRWVGGLDSTGCRLEAGGRTVGLSILGLVGGFVGDGSVGTEGPETGNEVTGCGVGTGNSTGPALGLFVVDGVEGFGVPDIKGVGAGVSPDPESLGERLGIDVPTACLARHTGESFALGRQSTKHSSPPLKHKEPGCSTESLPGPSSSFSPLQT
jgi:hypothetical protein